jgi:hypothetical protein
MCLIFDDLGDIFHKYEYVLKSKIHFLIERLKNREGEGLEKCHGLFEGSLRSYPYMTSRNLKKIQPPTLNLHAFIHKDLFLTSQNNGSLPR